MDPRPYQVQAVEKLRDAIRRGRKRIILESPTRSGKTKMGSMLVQGAVAKGKSVLWLADRRELIKQASDRFWDEGIEHGIILAGQEYQPHLVQIASKDTLWSRAFRGNSLKADGFDLIAIDEAHIASGRTVWAPVEANPNAIVIGLTATPAFPNGRGMGSHFEEIVKVITYAELRENGYLVPCRVKAPDPPDLSDLKKIGGDFAMNEAVESRFNTKRLVGNAVEHWLQWAPGRQTVVFATGKAHSMNLVAEFREAGILAEHIDGETPSDGFSPAYARRFDGGIFANNEREDILSRFNAGHFQVLCNVDVCSKGWDAPVCSCCILARPTDSLVWYRQATARILTKCEGKADAILIDMAGACYKHGFPDDDIDWPLDQNVTVEEHNANQNPEQVKPVVCPKCFELRKPAKKCPKCGYEARGNSCQQSLKLEHVEGELADVDRGNMAERSALAEQVKTWKQLCGMAANTGKSLVQIRAIFKSKFGTYPDSGICNIPSHQWSMPVADLMPHLKRKKKAAAT